MYGIFHIRSVSVGLDSQIWYLFIYITGYLNVRKMSETMDFRTFVGPLTLPELYDCKNCSGHQIFISRLNVLHAKFLKRSKWKSNCLLREVAIKHWGIYLLFTFYWAEWCHVVPGYVSLVTPGQMSGLPPVRVRLVQNLHPVALGEGHVAHFWALVGVEGYHHPQVSVPAAAPIGTATVLEDFMSNYYTRLLSNSS